MTITSPNDFDVLVIGGGITGLWTLDALDEAGFAAALIEPTGLGHGQTLAAQGIIHGGLKYTLRGLFSRSAEAISAMPERWRASLAGLVRPNLHGVRLASDATWLWRSESLSSKLAMVGARVGLRTKPVEVEIAKRPHPLANVPGEVFRVDEPVLDTLSLVDAFRTRHEPRLLHAAVESIGRTENGWTASVRSVAQKSGMDSGSTPGSTRVLRCRALLLAAGSGNAALRTCAGLDSPAMQLRPLHMTLMRREQSPQAKYAERGDLPELFGHCVDGAATRVTITTHRNSKHHNVWQLGGMLAEDGVTLDPSSLLARAASEVRAVLPGVDIRGVEWATYRVDRAEHSTSGGLRPDDAQCSVDKGIVTLWPTKLALAPRAAALALDAVRRANVQPTGPRPIDGPRPPLGVSPWETVTWTQQP